MLFPGTSLAARIERAESRFMADCAAAAERRRPGSGVFAMPLAGGFATFTSAGSPLNKVSGLGFAGPLDDGELAAAEKAFFDRGSHVQVEVSTLGDPEVVQALTRRGYVLQGFENVLGLSLPSAGAAMPPDGIQIAESPHAETRRLGRRPRDRLRERRHPGGRDARIPRPRPPGGRHGRHGVGRRPLAVRGAPGRRHRRAGRASGWAAASHSCAVRATLPEHRRRGVQSALLGARLRIAADAGCDVAVVTTAPGSKSQENVQRQGFLLLYARAILVRTP